MAQPILSETVHRIASALMLCLCITFAAHADTGRRVALVVGNGAYQNAPNLPNPPNDAKAVAAALRALDFEVIEALDLDQPDMLARVDDFSVRLEGADTGLFFYAGHGLQVGGENYLVPIDARLQREAQVRLQTLPLQTVLATMEAAVATRIVLLDACRDNPLAQALKRSMAASRSSSVGQGLAEVRTAVGTLIAYATGPGDVASDGKGEHSPFTSALLDHIATPGLEVRQVLGRVRDEVLKQTGDRQVPWDSSSLRGEFYFKADTSIVVAPPLKSSAPTPSTVITGYVGHDREAFEVIAESSRARDFAIFLERYPNSVFAPFAQSRLEELGKPRGSAAESATVGPGTGAAIEARAAVAALSPHTADGVLQQSPATGGSEIRSFSPAAVVLPEPAATEAALNLSRSDWQKLQESLTALGFDTRGADGKPGPKTRGALVDWQKSKAIIATGFLGQLQRDLILAEAMSESRTRLSSKNSSSKEQVFSTNSESQQAASTQSATTHTGEQTQLTRYDYIELQVALTSIGFDTMFIEGIPGPSFREAVAAWQSKNGMPATGFVDARQRDQILREGNTTKSRINTSKDTLFGRVTADTLLYFDDSITSAETIGRIEQGSIIEVHRGLRNGMYRVASPSSGYIGAALFKPE